MQTPQLDDHGQPLAAETMAYAHLTVTIPDSVWISDISRSYPETTFRVLAATASDSTGVAKLDIQGVDPERICAAIQAYDSVVALSVLDADTTRVLVQVETSVPVLMTSLQHAGVPLEMPFDVRDGELALEMTVPSPRLSALGETLDRFDIAYTVERIDHEWEAEPVLTDRQQRLVDEALTRGYYDTPREITLVELAEALDIAKSTCSELLHRAEERILKTYLGDHHATPPASTDASN